MQEALQNFFNCQVKIESLQMGSGLPFFMVGRRMQRVEMNGCRFVVIDLTAEPDVTVRAMKKQALRYEETFEMPVAYNLSVESVAMRNALVKNGVPFISLPGNAYLPFLGIVLQDIYPQNAIKTDKMMPATQMVFLELLYREGQEGILKSEAASRLQLTKTSVTRATAQLERMGLISQIKKGTEIRITRNDSRRAYYERAVDYLISPVQKVMEVKRDEGIKGLLVAGESALSMESSLNPPTVKEMAIYKGCESIKQFVDADCRIEENSMCMKVQLWKYDPALFARDGKVDPVSLACSLSGIDDERVEMSIEEMLEGL